MCYVIRKKSVHEIGVRRNHQLIESDREFEKSSPRSLVHSLIERTGFENDLPREQA